MDPKAEIEQLKQLINYHNNLYYNLDNPVLSDTQYDEISAVSHQRFSHATRWRKSQQYFYVHYASCADVVFG